MNKFLYGVSDFVKVDFINAILLGDMNISRLMTYAHKVESDELREHAKENKKARIGKYAYSKNKLGGGNISQSQQNFQPHPPHQLEFHPPRSSMLRRLGN